MEPENRKQNKIIMIGLLLIIFVVILTIFRSGSEKNDDEIIKEEPASYPQISAEDLKIKLARENNIQILDIRIPGEYRNEHIKDSINFEPEATVNGISPEKVTVIVGNINEKENISKAFNLLKNKGFKEIFVLTGGIEGWKRGGGSTISIGNPDSFVDQSKITYISPEDFKKAIEDKKFKYILDVRPEQSFKNSHIPGAENIYLENLEKLAPKIPSGKEIFVYGDTELQGFQAGVRLYDLNFFSVKVISGGFLEWKNKGFEIEK